MRISVDVCLACRDAKYINLKRCVRCGVPGCSHLRDRNRQRGHVCLARADECEAREKDRVMHVWIAELLEGGYCVTFTGRIDCHGKRVRRISDNNFVCAFCEKPVS